jgi:hypothetical protein
MGLVTIIKCTQYICFNARQQFHFILMMHWNQTIKYLESHFATNLKVWSCKDRNSKLMIALLHVWIIDYHTNFFC